MTGSGVLTGASKRSKRSAGFPTREIEINTGRNACAPLKQHEPDHPPPGRPDRDRRPIQNLQIPQQTEQRRPLDRVVANPVWNRHRFTKADYDNNELDPSPAQLPAIGQYQGIALQTGIQPLAGRGKPPPCTPDLHTRRHHHQPAIPPTNGTPGCGVPIWLCGQLANNPNTAPSAAPQT